MESKARILGHPIHPILIVFPLGLLATAVIFDIVALVSAVPKWAEFATYLTAAGVVGGLLAAVPGTIDWLAIPNGTRAKRVGLLHGVGNVIVVALFLGSSGSGSPWSPAGSEVSWWVAWASAWMTART